MHPKIFLLVLLLILNACEKQQTFHPVQIAILSPVKGSIIGSDTLRFSVSVSGSGNGLLKMSLLNENGISILSPQVFEANASDTIRGYFLTEHLDYTGSASLVALWQRNGKQFTKMVRILLASVSSYSDAFILHRSQGGSLRLIQLHTNGSIGSDQQLSVSGAISATWSAPAQTLAILQADGQSVVAIKPPFNQTSYILNATASPHKISLVASDGSRFWIGEMSGNLRAVRATDGSPLFTITAGPDSLPYAVTNCNQWTAVAYRSGANKHAVRVYYRNTGSRHSLWPLGGKVVDMVWRNEKEMITAVRRPMGIEFYEISTDPPAFRLLSSLNLNTSDSLVFVSGDACLVRSGLSITKFSTMGQQVWQLQWPSFPHIVAVKANSVWVRYGQNLIEISQLGQPGQVVVVPENAFTGTFFQSVYTPLKQKN